MAENKWEGAKLWAKNANKIAPTLVGGSKNMEVLILGLGAAIVSECDCIISWNFKHIVNIKTIRGVRAITNLKGHKPIEILNPSVLLESEE